MKNLKQQWLSTTLILLFLTFLNVSCNEDDEMLSDAKKITSFFFDASSNAALSSDIIGTINESAKTISLVVPYGTAITSLKPTIIVSEKATINTINATDFSRVVIYTVTAEDDSTVNYSVTVTDEPNDQKRVISFLFASLENGSVGDKDVNSIIDEDLKTITIYVPNTTDITNLLPDIQVSPEATFSPASFQNFTNPVMYSITAEDGTSVDYEVSVIPVQITGFMFSTFNDITGQTTIIGQGTVDQIKSEIEVVVSENQDVATLPAPSIVFTVNADIVPNGTQNFENPVNYILTAPNGVVVTYQVIVKRAFKQITSFRFNKSQNTALANDAIGSINENQSIIAVILPKNTNSSVLNSLIPSISVVSGSGATVSPTGAQNFSNAVVYTVTGLDGKTRTYTVSVIISP